MALKEDALIVGGAALALLLVGWLVKRQVGAAIDSVVDTVAPIVPYVNPADPNNVVYQANAWVGSQLTGDPYFTLGGWLYDETHYGNSMSDRINPVSSRNFVNSTVNRVGEVVTGDKGWTLGGQIYDWLH